jgi:hypothetical protein
MTTINISPPPIRPWLWWLLTIAAGFAFIAAISFVGVVRQEARQVSVDLAAIKKKIVAAEKPVDRKTIEEQSRWAALETDRKFNWAIAFSAIEKTLSPDIQLQAFVPDKANRTITVKCLASSNQAMAGYVAALLADSDLYGVHIVREQTNLSPNNNAIAFEVKMSIAKQ